MGQRFLKRDALDRKRYSAMQRSEYLLARRKFEPQVCTLIIVAESPPASGNYFYDVTGAVSEPLFSAIMLHLKLVPKTKNNGLLELQKKGWVLIDATYEPVNNMENPDRDRVIVRDYPLLREDLQTISPNRSVPIVLIKSNVCKILEPLLLADGFDVLNKHKVVYFPSTGRQKDFQHQFADILERQ